MYVVQLKCLLGKSKGFAFDFVLIKKV